MIHSLSSISAEISLVYTLSTNQLRYETYKFKQCINLLTFDSKKKVEKCQRCQYCVASLGVLPSAVSATKIDNRLNKTNKNLVVIHIQRCRPNRTFSSAMLLQLYMYICSNTDLKVTIEYIYNGVGDYINDKWKEGRAEGNE